MNAPLVGLIIFDQPKMFQNSKEFPAKNNL